MLKDKEIRLSTGLTLSFIGILQLCRVFGLLNSLSSSMKLMIFDWRTYLLYAAAFFLIFKADKTIGLILLILGLIFRFNIIYNAVMTYSSYIAPVSLLTGGLLLLFISLRKG